MQLHVSARKRWVLGGRLPRLPLTQSLCPAPFRVRSLWPTDEPQLEIAAISPKSCLRMGLIFHFPGLHLLVSGRKGSLHLPHAKITLHTLLLWIFATTCQVSKRRFREVQQRPRVTQPGGEGNQNYLQNYLSSCAPTWALPRVWWRRLCWAQGRGLVGASGIMDPEKTEARWGGASVIGALLPSCLLG